METVNIEIEYLHCYAYIKALEIIIAECSNEMRTANAADWLTGLHKQLLFAYANATIDRHGNTEGSH